MQRTASTAKTQTPLTYHCRWDNAHSSWVLANPFEKVVCYYEHMTDAWDYCKKLARAFNGVAIRYNSAGKEVERVE